MRAGRASWSWVVVALGCASRPATPSVAGAGGAGAPAIAVKHGAAHAKAARPDATCAYRVSVTRPSPLELRVVARCDGAGTTGFRVTEPAAVPFVHAAGGAAPRTLIPAIVTSDGGA